MKRNIILILISLYVFSVNLISSPIQSDQSNINEKNGRAFRSAEYCGQCHAKEYEEWRKSTHAVSNNNPVFQRFLNQFLSDTGNSNLNICLRCHTPAAVFNKDIEMKNPANNTPVSCEICHSLKGIDSKYELLFDLDGKMYSKNQATLGAGHNVFNDPNISKEAWCAPCHTAVNPKQKNYICAQNMRFDSWKKNTGRPEQCQDCHMRDENGNVDHSFRGISNPDLLKNVLKIRWDVTIEPANYKVKLVINNDKIAHLFPVGMSMKRVVIEAALVNSESKTLYKQEAYLGKLYEDRDGIWPVPGWRGSKVRIDNAISPLESRMMVFNLPIVAKADAIVLRIYYSRYPDEKDQPIIFLEQKKI